ncbi:RHS repeat domain-containing protein [Pseudomonas atacamensis]|jgi:insecticidal toxin complex protein TccC|uniref:RHS repeat domain-containing protein n=1 Tax=Pseudomonas atacamensis TaxID=2565368 RepID=UPI0024802BEE|nr:RHS repeat-associated core domain-containing protein [Pseudomonas atacamensis]WGT33244.1 RHS repeat-associated core domain-containing protein [Pseudomonas atacamensis]
MGIHRNTPTLAVNDPRGLAILNVNYWRADAALASEPRIERTLRDVAGRVVKQWDARLWALQVIDPQAPASLTTTHALNDIALRSDSSDAGVQVRLPGLAGQTLFNWDSRGTCREIAYDDLLRPVAVFEEGTGVPRRCAERFAYGRPGFGEALRNQLGQLIRHDDPAGSVLFEQFAITGQCCENTRHFVLESVVPDWPDADVECKVPLESEGATTQWRFSPQGSVLEQVDAAGHRQVFALTHDGRLRGVDLRLRYQTSDHPVVSDIRYNAEGQVTQELAGNGVLTTLSYRPEDGRLLMRHAQDQEGNVWQDLLYAYDPMGNVLSIEDQALPVRWFANQRIEPVSRYRYDSLCQLTHATGWEAGAAGGGPTAVANYSQSYRYDAAGNLLELTHVGPQSPGHQLQAARYSNRCLPWHDGKPPSESQIAEAFDARGNLLLLDQGRRLQWNLRNQLNSVVLVLRVSGADDCENYLYDGAGQRVLKTRSARTAARSLLAQVRYLPALELRTDTGTGESLQVLTVQTGLNTVRVLHWQSPPPTGLNNLYRYNFKDHLGSISVELDADARLISREHFYPFGATAWAKEPDVSYKTARYSGKERDATGLYYFGFRYYVPWLQRWLNTDPGGAIDGHNRYRAMRNNPVTYRDSDGRKPDKHAPDRVYHDLADQKLVNPVQAAGMQPVRRYFANDPNPDVQAYRREIPVALAELGARDNSVLNTHQAHVIAAARTHTAPPSGAVLYHSGEFVSSTMNRVLGEETTSRIMGPMSVAFNSPVEEPQVLAARRGAVAKGFQIGGNLLMHAANPAVQLVGSLSVAMGNAMQVSEAQTRIQYKLLSTPVAVPLAISSNSPAVDLQSFNRSTRRQPLFAEPESTPTPLAQQLFAAAFTQGPAGLAQGTEGESVDEDSTLARRRNSVFG